MSAPSEPLLSVTFVTYQHARYVRQALDSVLSQRTTFPFEVVIGEDGSSDGTAEICEEYVARHPGRVRLLRNGRLEKIRIRGRVTGRRNYLETLGATRGRYVAFLEGDDWWTDPDKLQLQVDLLEGSPDHGFCFHDVRQVRPDGASSALVPPRRDEVTARDLLERTYVHTSAVVYRRSVLPLPPPDWLVHESPVVDACMPVLVGLRHPGRRIPRVMSAYRVGVGTWSTQSRVAVLKDQILTRELLLRELPPEHAPALETYLARRRLRLACALLGAGEVGEARDALDAVDRRALGLRPRDLARLAAATAALRAPGGPRAWKRARAIARRT